MKKLLYVIPISVILILLTAALSLHSKAEMQTEDIPFSLESKKGIHPSAYCMNSNGTKLSDEYSYSGYFCIPGNSDDSINLMIYEGEYAYCIGTHSQKSPFSVTDAVKCTEISYDDANYQQYISTLTAASESKYGLNETDMYYITQCAIRTIRYGLPEDMMAFFTPDGNLNTEMTNEYKRILSESHTVYSQEDKHISIDNSNSEKILKLKNNEPYISYGPYYANADFLYDTLSLSLKENNKDIVLINQDGTEFNNEMEIGAGEAFYVMIHHHLETDCTITITASLSTVESTPVLYLAKDDKYQNIIQIRKAEKTNIISDDLTIHNENTHGTLTIQKRFEDSGIQITDKELYREPRFTVRLSTEEKYANGIYTDEGIIFTSFSDTPVEFALNENTGNIVISDLPEANYIISESQGANGYYSEENEKEIVFNSDECTVTFINLKLTPPETTTHDEKIDLSVTSLTTTEQKKPETSRITLVSSPKTGDKNILKLFLLMFTSSIMITVLYKRKPN